MAWIGRTVLDKWLNRIDHHIGDMANDHCDGNVLQCGQTSELEAHIYFLVFFSFVFDDQPVGSYDKGWFLSLNIGPFSLCIGVVLALSRCVGVAVPSSLLSCGLLSCWCDIGAVEGDMRSLFTGDSLVGICLGDSLLASCPRGDFSGDWLVFAGNLLLKTGMNYTYYAWRWTTYK